MIAFTTYQVVFDFDFVVKSCQEEQKIMNKRCCFAGHSKLYHTDDIYNNLVNLIEKLVVEEDVSEFWVGNYGNFDSLSAKAVRYLKEKYNNIQLNLVIPYLTSSINEYKKLYYKNYDHILMSDLPERTPKNFQILKCNEYMVDNSDFIVCYVQYSWGGAAKTLEYAQRKKHIEIFNLAQE